MPPLPIEVDGHNGPDADRPHQRDGERGDGRCQVDDHPAVLLIAGPVEAQARVAGDHMVVAQHPEIDHEDGIEPVRLVEDRRAGKHRQGEGAENEHAVKAAAAQPRRRTSRHRNRPAASEIWQ